MLSISAIAASGMNAAQAGLQVSANNIANLDTPGFRRQQIEQVPGSPAGVAASVRQAPEAGSAPESDVVSLLQNKNAFLANLSVFRAADRMTGSLLDAVS